MDRLCVLLSRLVHAGLQGDLGTCLEVSKTLTSSPFEFSFLYYFISVFYLVCFFFFNVAVCTTTHSNFPVSIQ